MQEDEEDVDGWGDFEASISLWLNAWLAFRVLGACLDPPRFKGNVPPS